MLFIRNTVRSFVPRLVLSLSVFLVSLAFSRMTAATSARHIALEDFPDAEAACAAADFEEFPTEI